jgi:hypothetical protein
MGVRKHMFMTVLAAIELLLTVHSVVDCGWYECTTTTNRYNRHLVHFYCSNNPNLVRRYSGHAA